jgi:hypothetical protein
MSKTQIRKRPGTTRPTKMTEPEVDEAEETEVDVPDDPDHDDTEQDTPGSGSDSDDDGSDQPDPDQDTPGTSAAPQNASERPMGAPRDGRILMPGDPVSFDADDMGSYLRVKEPVYRQIWRDGTRSPTYVLVFPAGHRVPKSNVKSPKQDKTDKPTENKLLTNVEVK